MASSTQDVNLGKRQERVKDREPDALQSTWSQSRTRLSEQEPQ